MPDDSQPVVLFDGICGLCTRSVRFIIRHDPHGRFRFASLQSAVGRRLAAGAGVQGEGMDTLILIQQGRAFVRSDAVLRIASRLGAPWCFAAPLLLVPRLLREPVYRLVARHRYRFFGRFDRLWGPMPGYEDRFLDTGGVEASVGSD
jgi:predicted DCC family thiol-disulfide oxidoreductase YuxK